jgi:hypothetical protein
MVIGITDMASSVQNNEISLQGDSVFCQNTATSTRNTCLRYIEVGQRTKKIAACKDNIYITGVQLVCGGEA